MSSRLIPPNRRLHEGDDLIDIRGVDAERKRVDSRELLEEHRLALHHEHGRHRPDVAQPEHRRAVADDGDGAALDRQGPHTRRVVANGRAHARDPRRVRHRQIVPRRDRHLRAHLDLAALVQQERAVRDAVDAHVVDVPDDGDDPIRMLCIHTGDGDVADDLRGLHAYEVDGAQDGAGVSDRGGDLAERPGPLRHVDTHREAVGGRRLQRRRRATGVVLSAHGRARPSVPKVTFCRCASNPLAPRASAPERLGPRKQSSTAEHVHGALADGIGQGRELALVPELG
jgi:hypothetical protein